TPSGRSNFDSIEDVGGAPSDATATSARRGRDRAPAGKGRRANDRFGRIRLRRLPPRARRGHGRLVADEGLNTLAGLHSRIHVRAGHGRNGTGKNRDGCRGDDAEVRVPCGTVVRELYTQKVAGELRLHGDRLVVATGGRGGQGNAAFMTQRRTAPDKLRLVADVGFLGMPRCKYSCTSRTALPKIPWEISRC
ncbi:hypothetical protein ACHAWF_002421, partial [Thalassiosira exigua]